MTGYENKVSSHATTASGTSQNMQAPVVCMMSCTSWWAKLWLSPAQHICGWGCWAMLLNCGRLRSQWDPSLMVRPGRSYVTEIGNVYASVFSASLTRCCFTTDLLEPAGCSAVLVLIHPWFHGPC